MQVNGKRNIPLTRILRETMLKNICKLEVKILEKDFQFLCDNESPLAHVKEALFQFLKYVGQIEDQVKAQTESQQELDKLVQVDEEPKPENTQEKIDDQPAI